MEEQWDTESLDALRGHAPFSRDATTAEELDWQHPKHESEQDVSRRSDTTDTSDMTGSVREIPEVVRRTLPVSDLSSTSGDIGCTYIYRVAIASILPTVQVQSTRMMLELIWTGCILTKMFPMKGLSFYNHRRHHQRHEVVHLHQYYPIGSTVITTW